MKDKKLREYLGLKEENEKIKLNCDDGAEKKFIINGLNRLSSLESEIKSSNDRFLFNTDKIHTLATDVECLKSSFKLLLDYLNLEMEIFPAQRKIVKKKKQ